MSDDDVLPVFDAVEPIISDELKAQCDAATAKSGTPHAIYLFRTGPAVRVAIIANDHAPDGAERVYPDGD